MMTLYLTPYRRLAMLRNTMDRMFDEAFTGESSPEREMALAVDISSDDEAYTLRALVPGLEADDLNVEILNNTVTIRGEFHFADSEDTKYLTCELPHGRFSRVLTLPVDVDATKVEANIKNGVLTLHLPKAEAHRPKLVKINLN